MMSADDIIVMSADDIIVMLADDISYVPVCVTKKPDFV
jgi:hypothetical protein